MVGAAGLIKTRPGLDKNKLTFTRTGYRAHSLPFNSVESPVIFFLLFFPSVMAILTNIIQTPNVLFILKIVVAPKE